jgi:hypothetical protein
MDILLANYSKVTQQAFTTMKISTITGGAK